MRIHVTVPDANYELRPDGVQGLVTGAGVYRRVKLGKDLWRAYLNAIFRGQLGAPVIAYGLGFSPGVGAQQDMR